MTSNFEDWLFNYIFPLEAKFADAEFAYLGHNAFLPRDDPDRNHFIRGRVYFFADYGRKSGRWRGRHEGMARRRPGMKFPTKFIKDPAKAFDILEEYVDQMERKPSHQADRIRPCRIHLRARTASRGLHEFILKERHPATDPRERDRNRGRELPQGAFGVTPCRPARKPGLHIRQGDRGALRGTRRQRHRNPRNVWA